MTKNLKCPRTRLSKTLKYSKLNLFSGSWRMKISTKNHSFWSLEPQGCHHLMAIVQLLQLLLANIMLFKLNIYFMHIVRFCNSLSAFTSGPHFSTQQKRMKKQLILLSEIINNYRAAKIFQIFFESDENVESMAKQNKNKTKNRFEIGKGANFCRIMEIIPKGKNVHKS